MPEETRRERLEAVEAKLDAARAEWKREKHALREEKRAVKKDWTPTDLAARQVRKEQKAARLAARRAKAEPPVRPLWEEVGNSVTHGIGAVLSLIGLILLLIRAKDGVAVLSACVYGGCLFLLFLMSCLYHAFPTGSRVKRLWRRFDYSSIYLLIGGSITPVLLLFVDGTLGVVLTIVMWALIVTGITFIGVFGPAMLRGMHFALYFTIGWSAIVFLPKMWAESRALFWCILLGGVVYTIGMIPFARKNKGAHFLWHIFVLAGAALHWFGIWKYIF